MALLAFIGSPMFGDFAAAYKALKPEEIQLNFAAISDTHLKGDAFTAIPLAAGLKDMSESETPLDAVVIAGDITDHGEREQWERVASTFSKHKAAENIILAAGNHDTWTTTEDGETIFGLYSEFNKKIAGREIENMYYSCKVNGYTFIVLGSEEDHTYATFTDTQLEWLRNEMAVAALDGKPIFVISHWAINGLHGLPYSWDLQEESDPTKGGIGEASDAVEAILKSYENVFLITGHIHLGLANDEKVGDTSYSSVESEGSFHSINLPCYTNMSQAGARTIGTGYQFEVYEDEVVLRARDFVSGTWYTLYDCTVPLV